LRPCAGAAIDEISANFEDNHVVKKLTLGLLLPKFIPKLALIIRSSNGKADWVQLEAAILVLGAIAEGAKGDICDYFPGKGETSQVEMQTLPHPCSNSSLCPVTLNLKHFKKKNTSLS